MPVVMQIEGITFDGKLGGFEGWSLLNSFKWSGHRVVQELKAVGGHQRMVAQAPQMTGVTISRDSDDKTAAMWERMISRASNQKVQFVWLRTGQDGLLPYFTVKLEDAVITDIKASGNSSGPQETMTLSYLTVTAHVVNYLNSLTGAQDVVRYSLPTAVRS